MHVRRWWRLGQTSYTTAGPDGVRFAAERGIGLRIHGLLPVLVLSLGAALALAGPARASTTVYEYHVEHPRYGDIGTYNNVVKQTGDDFEVKSELHIAVKILGIVVFREDGKRTENWQGDRLVSFEGVTETNGDRIEVHGEARGDTFVVTTPDGVVTAPARVHPSNPWRAKVLDTDTLISTKTGRVETVSVRGGDEASVTLDGRDLRLRQYEIDGTKRQFVWLDDRGVAVAFRTDEAGTPIDFILTHAPQIEAENHLP